MMHENSNMSDVLSVQMRFRGRSVLLNHLDKVRLIHGR